MIATLLAHKIRKDLLRDNKKNNHRQYLLALHSQPRLRYWAGYHKKKLIFLALLALVSWNYELHLSLYNSLLTLSSPQQFLLHLFLGSPKVEKTVNEQKVVGWQFGDDSLHLLTKLYYEADTRLIFGVGRNYLFQVYSHLGLLEKPEEAQTFWRGGGFHKRRNQLVSGVGYQQFLTLYSEGFRTLSKTTPELTADDYLKQFLTLFLQKAPEIEAWEKQFNKVRYSEYLKTLLTDSEKKYEEIGSAMGEDTEVREEVVDQKLREIGMKGMGLKDRWVYWKNREVLVSLREYTLHKRLGLTILEGRERMELQRRLKEIEAELGSIAMQKQALKSEYHAIYEEDLF